MFTDGFGNMVIDENLNELEDKNVISVIRKYYTRANHGLQKYGVTTERNDLTLFDWLNHLQDELMDATIYVERLKRDIMNATL